MTSVDPGDRLRLLFDWAHDGGRRLALWILVAIVLHAGAYLLFRIEYPRPEPARISDAPLYVLLPGSPEAMRLAPFLASADPALLSPERADRLILPTPAIPAYKPSFAATTPELAPLPDPQPRVLPPLLRDFGPVPIADTPAPHTAPPFPASETQIVFSDSLRSRAPREWPKAKFTTRPGDQLAPARFLLAVAPDGRVLHVLKSHDTPGADTPALDDASSRLLMRLRFQRGGDSQVAWGAATFYWGLDVKREEPH
ncbi:MAG: hypothetical protein PHC88_09345 [Terrimicrobiaceae bacterium]|nr:hypothetical protein [Terrimicrobiaceae bacterium]